MPQFNPTIDPISLKNVQSGLMTVRAVSKSLKPIDALTESINVKFNKIGSAQIRGGTTLLGNALSGDILGLYEFRDSGTGSNNQIVLVNADKVKYLSAGTWTDKRTVTTGKKARFTTFLDFLWMVNNQDSTAIWDGAAGDSFVTTGNAASAPIGKFIDNFRSHVWIAGSDTYPDRVWFSSLPSAVTTPIVTWNTSVTVGDWIDVAPQDGENITGIKRSKKGLLVFKNSHIYPIYSISQTEPDPVTNVGTYSNESIVEAKDGIYFHHPSGFFKYNVGSEPEEISKPIVDIIRNISVANYSKICGWMEPSGDDIVWAVGDVTIDGTTYSNLEVRYTISTQTWTHYMKPTQALVSSSYNDGTTLFKLIGDTAGSVLKMDTGTTDNGTPISVSIITRWFDDFLRNTALAVAENLTSTRKHLVSGLFAHEGGTGFNVNWQNEEDLANPNDWSKPVGNGQLDDFDTIFDNMDVKGRTIRFRISGTSTGQPFDYHGFEIVNGYREIITF